MKMVRKCNSSLLSPLFLLPSSNPDLSLWFISKAHPHIGERRHAACVCFNAGLILTMQFRSFVFCKIGKCPSLQIFWIDGNVQQPAAGTGPTKIGLSWIIYRAFRNRIEMKNTLGYWQMCSYSSLCNDGHLSQPLFYYLFCYANVPVTYPISVLLTGISWSQQSV